MTIDELFERRRDIAALVVKDLLADISDRRGFKHQWDQIDPDVRQEIEEAWRKIVYRKLYLYDGRDEG